MENFLLEKINNSFLTQFEGEDRIKSLVILIYFFITGYLLILFDLFTGLIKSKIKKQAILSRKWTRSIIKFILMFVFFIFLCGILLIFKDSTLRSFFLYVPFSLLLFQEFISIGENIEKIFNKKFYLFKFMEKIFFIVEGGFLKFTEKIIFLLENKITSALEDNSKKESPKEEDLE